MTDPLAQSQAYFDAWNNRDADAILAGFGESGFYTDPAAGQPLSGVQLAGYVKGLWASFADLHFEVTSLGLISEDTVAAEWTMRGTHSGSFRGLPPTGNSIELNGSDFIRVQDDGIASVTGYFDTAALPRQLGLQIVVQPYQIGPFEFGNSVSVQSGNRARPGAFSVTQLRARTDEEAEEIRNYSRQIAQEMCSMEGFITTILATVGHRMMTITAWEQPEHVDAIYKNAAHTEAMNKFFGEDLASAGMASLMTPEHISRMLRCDACGTMTDLRRKDASKTCVCGTELPDNIPWW